MLARYCISCNVNKDKAETLGPFAQDIDVRAPTGFFLFSPEGKCLGVLWQRLEPVNADNVVDFILPHVRTQHIAATPDSQHIARPSSKQVLASEDLGFEAVARYVSTQSLQAPAGCRWSLPPYPKSNSSQQAYSEAAQSFGERTAFPVVWQDALTPHEAQAMLPGEGGALPSTWTPSTAVLKKLLFQLRPSTHYTHLSIEDVESLDCTAQVLSQDQRELIVGLAGTLQAPDPWFPIGDYDFAPAEAVVHKAKATFAGYLHYSMPQRRLVRFALVTQEAYLYGPDGTLLPYMGLVHGPCAPTGPRHAYELTNKGLGGS